MTYGQHLTIKSENLELIYNLHSVCEALIYDSLRSACALFCERVRKTSALMGGSIPQVESMIMITSLNRCLYDFFQFYMHLSFTECCCRNLVKADSMKSNEDLQNKGIQLLKDYHDTFCRNREASSHIDKARTYIKDHLNEPLTLENVGNAIHISANYLSRIFSRLTGQSFCDYVREERITFGRKLLASTDMSIDSIADKCGFSTPGYFATVFRHYMGMSPKSYRQSLR